ncbi:hypothetical protein IQ91_24960 [Salmonella enterica]|nr:hypothetical protein [Salmonella enterica]HAS8353763.1 hypothetical protein [Vibrio vulnificus]
MKKSHLLILSITCIATINYANANIQSIYDPIKKEFEINKLKKNETCEVHIKWRKGENQVIIESTKGNDKCLKEVIKAINNASYQTFTKSGNAIIDIKPD